MADAFHIFLKRSSLSQTRIYILPPFLVFPRVHMKLTNILISHISHVPLYSNCKSFKYTITFLCNVWLTILHWIDLHTSAPPSASSSLELPPTIHCTSSRNFGWYLISKSLIFTIITRGHCKRALHDSLLKVSKELTANWAHWPGTEN